ncbi:ctr copper transporter family protein [Sarocladium implicatum]|nr:ctr copper transporter family protein [Sarocladium implicatum]
MEFFPRHDMSGGDHAEEAAPVATDHTHDQGHDSMSMESGHGGMHMFFQTDENTPLFASAWTPNSAGTYAATCIFLIVLAALARGLIAYRSIQEARWLDRDASRRYVSTAQGRTPLAERISQDRDAKSMTLSENGMEENVFVVERKRGIVRPWRFSVDPIRAVLDTVIAGVGYLLMLAVMTYNVGYFLSVLGGVFIGTLAVGRYTVVSEH